MELVEHCFVVAQERSQALNLALVARVADQEGRRALEAGRTGRVVAEGILVPVEGTIQEEAIHKPFLGAHRVGSPGVLVDQNADLAEGSCMDNEAAVGSVPDLAGIVADQIVVAAGTIDFVGLYPDSLGAGFVAYEQGELMESLLGEHSIQSRC